MLQLTSLLVGIFSTVAVQVQPASGTAAAYHLMPEYYTVSQNADAEVKIPTIEEQVREYFSDTPVLAEIARCESTFRHMGSDGKILRGVVVSDDVGVMQINEHYHGENAKKLGYDLMTLEGNMSYAKRIYGIYGTSPWSASKACWGSKKAS